MKRRAWVILVVIALCLVGQTVLADGGECEVRIYPGQTIGGTIMEWAERQGWNWPAVKRANPALFGDWLDNPERPLQVYSPACAVEPSGLIIRVEDGDPDYNVDTEALAHYLHAMGVRKGMIIVRLFPETLWWHHLTLGFIPTHALAQGVTTCIGPYCVVKISTANADKAALKLGGPPRSELASSKADLARLQQVACHEGRHLWQKLSGWSRSHTFWEEEQDAESWEDCGYAIIVPQK